MKWIVTAAVGLCGEPVGPAGDLNGRLPGGPSSRVHGLGDAGDGGSGRYSVACRSARSLSRFFAFLVGVRLDRLRQGERGVRRADVLFEAELSFSPATAMESTRSSPRSNNLSDRYARGAGLTSA